MTEAKTGNRNNTNDRGTIRKVRQLANEIVSHTIQLEPNDEDAPEISPTEDDRHFIEGNPLKAISATEDELRVGNYIVLFGDPTRRDLEGIASRRKNDDGTNGEWFSPNVDVESEYTKAGVLHVDWEHGTDPEGLGSNPNNVLGYVDWKTAKKDRRGIFVERVLSRRNEYVKWLEELIKAGLVGNSSQAIGQEAQKTERGEITRWPLVRDTLTVNPMEFRMLTENHMQAFKALHIPVETPTEPEQPTGEPEGAGNAPASEGEAAKAVISTPVISQPIKEENPMEITPEIQNLVDGAVETALKAFADKLPTNGAGGVVVTKDESDQPFKSLGEYFMCVKNAGISPRDMDKRLYATKAPTGAGELLPSDGGFLVPPQYASGILEKMYSTGQILSRVARDPISGNRMIYPGIDETSRAAGSRQGGVLGYWVAEAGTITATHPKFRQVDLKLNKVAALVYATDEILADVNTLGSWIGRVAPEELRFQVEDAIFEGNGVGKPQGIMSANALTTVLRNELLLVAYADIVNMWARRWAAYKDYVWLVNQEVMPQLNSLVLANSSDPNARFASFSQDGTISLMGRPVIEVEYASALGTVGDIVLVSPSQYQTIDNGGIQAASSIHVNFASDEQVFRFIYRVDGAPLWSSALTPFKGSGTLSPYVCLATATA